MEARFFGFLPPGVERVAHARALGLDGEINQRGGAAEGRGFCAGLEIVAGGGAAEGHVEVRVNVNAAGKNEHAGGINYFFAGSGLQIRADFLDALAFDANRRRGASLLT